ncbi:MAG: terminase small subunit [Xylophilus ampelinus]
MAGAKGRSGGARPGAGRPPKEPAKLDLTEVMSKALLHTDPKAFLMAVMNDPATEAKLRVDAAKSLMPFVHKKLGEGGKKDQALEEAEKVASRFAPAAPPKLVAAMGQKC